VKYLSLIFIMSLPARIALLLMLVLGSTRLLAAESDELASLRAKAERGNALAQYNLGLAYIQGRLGPTDPAEAFAWLTLAAENGATGKALDSLLGNITDQQLADGRKRLETYRAALAKSAPSAHPTTPKLAPRGFSIETPPAPATPADGKAAPLTKAPEPVAAPATTSPVDGDEFAAEAFAWLSLASETGTTSKALNTVLSNITDKQLAEGRRRLEIYRAGLAAKGVAAKGANPARAAEAQIAAPVTSPAEGTDLAGLEKARAELSTANAELASLRASVTRLEAATTEANAKIDRLTAELAEARKAPAGVAPPATPAPDEKTQPQNPAAPKP